MVAHVFTVNSDCPTVNVAKQLYCSVFPWENGMMVAYNRANFVFRHTALNHALSHVQSKTHLLHHRSLANFKVAPGA